jgi:hypothetical protein
MIGQNGEGFLKIQYSLQRIHFSKSEVDELDGPAVSAVRHAIAEVKQRWSNMRWIPKFYYLELLRASEGTLSRWYGLHLQSLAPTNPHWAMA